MAAPETNKLIKVENQKDLNDKVGLGAHIIDSIDLGSIFVLFLTETFKRFLEETAKYFLFPIAAAMSIASAIIAFNQARLEKGKKNTIPNAIVAGASAVAVTVAVVGGFVASSLFAMAAPIIFGAVTALKCLYNIGAATYYGARYALTDEKTNSKEKKEYGKAAINHSMTALAVGLASVAVVGVMILSKSVLAWLGIGAAVIGTGKGCYDLYKKFKGPTKSPGKKVPAKNVTIHVEPAINNRPTSSPSLIHKRLRNNSDPTGYQSKALHEKNQYEPPHSAPILIPLPNNERMSNTTPYTSRFSYHSNIDVHINDQTDSQTFRRK